MSTCPVVTSPGAYGFTPWADFDHGYYAVLAMDGPVGEASDASVLLFRDLAPLIVSTLGL